MFVKFCVCPSFPFGIESRMWVVVILIPDHCLSVYYLYKCSVCRNQQVNGRKRVPKHFCYFCSIMVEFVE